MKRVLLDTQFLLRALAAPTTLPLAVRTRLEDPGIDVLFSVASLWELTVKRDLGRISCSVEDVAQAAAAGGFSELPIRAEAVARAAELSPRSGDPFDRLLIAQAICESARFLTADAALAGCSDLVVHVA